MSVLHSDVDDARPRWRSSLQGGRRGFSRLCRWPSLLPDALLGLQAGHTCHSLICWTLAACDTGLLAVNFTAIRNACGLGSSGQQSGRLQGGTSPCLRRGWVLQHLPEFGALPLGVQIRQLGNDVVVAQAKHLVAGRPAGLSRDALVHLIGQANKTRHGVTECLDTQPAVLACKAGMCSWRNEEHRPLSSRPSQNY